MTYQINLYIPDSSIISSVSNMDVKARQKLKVYRAIDNDYRLNVLTRLRDEPDIAFNDLAKKVMIDRALLAYHVGVLKDVGLIESKYERRSKKSSKYRLTDEGIKILKEFKLVKTSTKKAKKEQ